MSFTPFVKTDIYIYRKAMAVWYEGDKSIEEIPNGDFGGLNAFEEAVKEEKHPHICNTTYKKLGYLLRVIEYKKNLIKLVMFLIGSNSVFSDVLGAYNEKLKEIIEYLTPEVNLENRILAAMDVARKNKWFIKG